MNTPCPECQIKESLARISAEEIMEKAAGLPFKEGITSPDHIFKERMAACLKCPACISGTTCSYSGSWCAYRARVIQNTCPFPGINRWDIKEV
ncbi:hypothetical protein [Treponema sp.]|uniref:hypothetical protein n=1 Tax=Treponema sp. TaxID=166 RepID=UPI0025FE86F1|nr:hypothetical protein [Treponema sp.]MCR5218201.1 hypothetical protein [Treponema sp.]